jgi:hypothetical protein
MAGRRIQKKVGLVKSFDQPHLAMGVDRSAGEEIAMIFARKFDHSLFEGFFLAEEEDAARILNQQHPDQEDDD